MDEARGIESVLKEEVYFLEVGQGAPAFEVKD
jgi:hypothetical protein